MPSSLRRLVRRLAQRLGLAVPPAPQPPPLRLFAPAAPDVKKLWRSRLVVSASVAVLVLLAVATAWYDVSLSRFLSLRSTDAGHAAWITDEALLDSVEEEEEDEEEDVGEEADVGVGDAAAGEDEPDAPGGRTGAPSGGSRSSSTAPGESGGSIGPPPAPSPVPQIPAPAARFVGRTAVFPPFNASFRAPGWADVGALCAAGAAAADATPGAPPLAGVIMPAPHWAALRVGAYGALHTPHGGSAFPVNTTSLPWRALPELRDPAAVTAARLLLTPAFAAHAAFDVLLDGGWACRLAADVAGVAAVEAASGKRRAGACPYAGALLADDPVVGYAPAGGGADAVGSTPLWGSVHALAVRGAASGGGAPPAVVTAACGGAAAGDAGSPAPASAPCAARPWAPPSAMLRAQTELQAALFRSAPAMALHDAHQMVKKLPSAGDLFAEGTPGNAAVRARNASGVQAAFNPPDVAPLAGTYLTAFHVVVTGSGGLVSMRRGAGAGEPPAPGGGGGSNATGHPPAPLAVEHTFRTTCEGPQADAPPREAWGSLPLHDEVVVLTHRIEWNIYHWFSESLGKAAPLVDYLRAHPHVKLHVLTMPSVQRKEQGRFRWEHTAMLGLDWEARVVSGPLRARVVHYPDPHGCGFQHALWALALRERLRGALGLPPSPLAVVGGGAAPPSPLVALLPPGAVGTLPAAVASTGRRVVVLRRRRTRRFHRERALLALLRRVVRGAGGELVELHEREMPNQTQALEWVGGATVLLGAHGAGQANALVAPAGACVIEAMPEHWFVPCYWRLAGQLGLRYHMFWVPGGSYHGRVKVHAARLVSTLRRCLGTEPAPRRGGAARGGSGAAAARQGKAKGRPRGGEAPKGGAGGAGGQGASPAASAAAPPQPPQQPAG